MTPDELYEMGYKDGKEGKSANPSHVHDDNYEMGFKDGEGDRARNRAVDPQYTVFNEAPVGFEFTGQKRVANPGEWYLTKNGNAKRQVGVRKNEQTRHILKKL